MCFNFKYDFIEANNIIDIISCLFCFYLRYNKPAMRDIVRMFLLLSAIISLSFGSECKRALENFPEFVDLKNFVASLKQDIVQLQAKGI